jgi:hypothetical protein
VGQSAAVHGVDPEAVDKTAIVIRSPLAKPAAIICRLSRALKLCDFGADMHAPALREAARLSQGHLSMHPFK